MCGRFTKPPKEGGDNEVVHIEGKTYHKVKGDLKYKGKSCKSNDKSKSNVDGTNKVGGVAMAALSEHFAIIDTSATNPHQVNLA
jgi:hypothetical protein